MKNHQHRRTSFFFIVFCPRRHVCFVQLVTPGALKHQAKVMTCGSHVGLCLFKLSLKHSLINHSWSPSMEIHLWRLLRFDHEAICTCLFAQGRLHRELIFVCWPTTCLQWEPGSFFHTRWSCWKNHEPWGTKNRRHRFGSTFFILLILTPKNVCIQPLCLTNLQNPSEAT